MPAEIALEAQGAALDSLDILYVAGADFERSAALAREAKLRGSSSMSKTFQNCATSMCLLFCAVATFC